MADDNLSPLPPLSPALCPNLNEEEMVADSLLPIVPDFMCGFDIDLYPCLFADRRLIIKSEIDPNQQEQEQEQIPDCQTHSEEPEEPDCQPMPPSCQLHENSEPDCQPMPKEPIPKAEKVRDDENYDNKSVNRCGNA